MTTVTVIGATGYAGSHLVRELLDRGHDVTAVARDVSALDPQERLHIQAGSIAVPGPLADVLESCDVLVLATHALLDDGVTVADLLPSLLVAAGPGTRLGIVGGAGSLLVGEGGPRFVDTPRFPDAIRPESRAQCALLDVVRAGPAELDWFCVTPPGYFGASFAGERKGTYRTGGDVLLVDDNGAPTAISGSDFAAAFVDELETPRHRRQRFTVGY